MSKPVPAWVLPTANPECENTNVYRSGRVPSLAGRLSAARDFIEVGTQVCALAAELGVVECTATLHAASGRPVLVVDNVQALSREDRIGYFVEGWLDDLVLRELRERHAPVDGPSELAVPLLVPGDLIGSLRFRYRRSLAAELRRDLCAIGTHVSVRLAQLGIQAQPESLPFSSLTPRQLGVALLAARGSTNGEIAAALDLSENTIKKHLKDVFERIGISNRTELASLVARACIASVTEHECVTITRG
jgi:DNA-binding CsgD family transcriptional regulator